MQSSAAPPPQYQPSPNGHFKPLPGQAESVYPSKEQSVTAHSAAFNVCGTKDRDVPKSKNDIFRIITPVSTFIFTIIIITKKKISFNDYF